MNQILQIFQSFDFDGSRQLNFNEFKNCAFAQDESDETFLKIMRGIRSRQEKKKMTDPTKPTIIPMTFLLMIKFFCYKTQRKYLTDMLKVSQDV